MRKAKSDAVDIKFLINWLADRNMYIWFDKYLGKSKVELLATLLVYHNAYLENMELVGQLKGIVHPEDWEEMMGLKF